MPDLQSVSNSSEDAESDARGMPDLERASEDDGDEGLEVGDWFSEVGDDADEYRDEGWGELDSEASGSSAASSTFCLVASPKDEAAQAAPTFVNNTHARRELYDSGTTRHISPYADDFESLTNIAPRTFTAANQQGFEATGKGDMIISVPNGLDFTKLRLTEVLYSPEVGYTLVSIGRLEDQGLTSTFSQGYCTITTEDGEVIGKIPKSSNGLYRVAHDHDDIAHAADDVETLSVMELHRRMGHIAPRDRAQARRARLRHWRAY